MSAGNATGFIAAASSRSGGRALRVAGGKEGTTDQLWSAMLILVATEALSLPYRAAVAADPLATVLVTFPP
jgi:hypothetical protein